MADIQKLDEAFLRFEVALQKIEEAVVQRIAAEKRMAELESEGESLRRDKARLTHELDLLRSQVRMAKNMGYIDFKKYEHWSRLNDEIGRMVGGWVKAFAGDGNGGAR